ncbi:DUF6510 family protein [Amycolatopsis sp. NPDC004368]
MTTALDGNAIAGTLRAAFGAEMTTAEGSCATCGARGPLAQMRVYAEAPGVVGRCDGCDNVLMVIVQKGTMACVDVSGFSQLDQPEL